MKQFFQVKTTFPKRKFFVSVEDDTEFQAVLLLARQLLIDLHDFSVREAHIATCYATKTCGAAEFSIFNLSFKRVVNCKEDTVKDYTIEQLVTLRDHADRKNIHKDALFNS